MKVKPIVILMIFLLTAVPAWNIADAKTPVNTPMTIVGTVEAADSSARPPTFVLRTKVANGKKLIVGCRIDDKTLIRAGKHKARLEDFRPGEKARLTYLRVEDGLVCVKITEK